MTPSTPIPTDAYHEAFAAEKARIEAARVKPLDRYENAIAQLMKRAHKPTLSQVVTIWVWRCAITPDYTAFNLPFIAEWLYGTCERLELLGPSSATPVAFGGVGVLLDAAPEREWALSLDIGNRGPLDAMTRLYWARIIAVLCSRLMMAKVSDLPGYNHEAIDGPFRYNGNSGEVIEVLPEDWDEMDRARAATMKRITEGAVAS